MDVAAGAQDVRRITSKTKQDIFIFTVHIFKVTVISKMTVTLLFT